MRIDKEYYTLPEILERWDIPEEDLVYLAEDDRLRLSARVFGVPLEFGDYEETAEGEHFRVPFERQVYSGLVGLHARDVFQLYRCGELHVRDFRAPNADYVTLRGEAEPVHVMIGDLLLTREERDRFEAQNGFSAAQPAVDEEAFVASADYRDVRLGAHGFKLGPIQAEVVRALHEAALAGTPWQSGKAILSRAGSRSLRMADVFKSKPDWRDLILSDRRGGYRLKLD